MTFKSSSSSNPRTYLAIPDAAARTLPNAPWALGCVVVLDGNLANTTNQSLIVTGSQNVASSFRLVINTGISQPEVNTFLNASASGTSTLKFTPTAGAAYLIVVQRGADGVMKTKMCPVLTTSPTDGSAVVTSTISNPTLATDMPGAGIGVGGVQCMMIGERANDQRCDQSIERVFRFDGALTDLEIAKLAYGLELGDLSKTPVWYFRLKDGSDTADLGPNKYAVTLSQSPLPTGTAPGYGYVSVNSAPTVTAPSMSSPVQAGTTVTASSGTVAGYPFPQTTWQWLINGAAISGATNATYVPTVDDVGKTLSVKQIVSSNQGTSNATSTGVVVAAAANAVYVTPPDNERIYQRSGTSAVVPFSGTYTGTQPTTIEMQTYLSDGVTVARAWFNTGATIAAGGTWTASINMPQTAEKVRPQVRSKDASGNIIGQPSAIHANRFGVGDLIAFLGSSSAETWDAPVNGTTPVVNTVSRFKDSWGVYTTKNYADTMASAIAAKAGVVVGILPYGVGGTSMDDWNVTDRLGVWSSFSAAVRAVGGKLAGLFGTLGSNDAAGGPGNVQSHASHAAKIRLTNSRVRSLTAQPNLNILWSGYNRRTAQSTGMTQAQFDTQSNYVRMAENEVGDDANVYHVQALDYELSADGIHLTTGAVSGYMACAQRMAYVWNAAIFDGVYKRGPKITALVASGSSILGTVLLRGGDTDVVTPLSKTGFAVTDASGALGITSVTRIDATHFSIACDRALVSPVQVTYLAGSAPPVDGAIYGNGTLALPMAVETELATTWVESSVTVSGVAVSPSTATGSTTFSATVSGSGSPSQTVTWAATAGTITSGGVFTAPAATASAQTITITATSTVDPTKYGTATVTIPAAVPTVTGVSVSPGTASVAGGATQQFNATVAGTNSPSQSVTWSATAGTISSSGLFTAPTATSAAQTITITATSVADSSKSGTATVTVAAAAPTVTSVTVSPSAASISSGGTQQFSAAVVGTNTPAQTVTWSATGGSINASGLFTGPAVTGASQTITVTATSTVNTSKTGTAVVTVTAAQQQSGAGGFTPSTSRTLKVLAGRGGFSAEGGFWDLSNPDKPVGIMDPNAILDISIDWTQYLADIGAPTLSLGDFTVAGVQNVSVFGRGNLTILFASALPGSASASVTCRIATNTTPQIVDERTFYLKFEDK